MLSAPQSHQSRKASQLFPLLQSESQPASADAQMNDCCLRSWIISQETCARRRLCLPALLGASLFVFLCWEKQNAVGRNGEEEAEAERKAR